MTNTPDGPETPDPGSANTGTSGSCEDVVEKLRGGLVVSCQAREGHPLRDSEVIGRLAACAELGGAVGLRINSPDDVRAARHRSDLPIIGLHKVWHQQRYIITPEVELAHGLVAAGADIVALDCTEEVPAAPARLLQQVQGELQMPVMADISTLEEGKAAWDSGADLVGTTLSGYTAAQLPTPSEPDLELVGQLAQAGIRVVAEGRYATGEHVHAAFDAGAWAVVVGTAITDPVQITRGLVTHTPRTQP